MGEIVMCKRHRIARSRPAFPRPWADLLIDDLVVAARLLERGDCLVDSPLAAPDVAIQRGIPNTLRAGGLNPLGSLNN
jgi:hypothetical protein